MIEQLRREIRELNEQIAEWESEVELLEDQLQDLESNISDARTDIEEKESQIERLETEAERTNLVEQLTTALANMDIDQLASLVSSIQNGETPSITVEHPTITVDENGGINAEDVTYDMLTNDMHNAVITLVGTKYQDLWRIHNRSPEIGDIITLAKRDGRSTQSTVGYTEDGISIGILPASDEKFEQLQNIGANSINNRDVDLDNPILERNYKVVGVIPAAFIFLDPIYDEAENIEETVAEAVSQLESIRRRLYHTAQTVDEARHVFNEEMPDHCRIDNVVEQDNIFIINYQNHRANTTAEYYQSCEVERAE